MLTAARRAGMLDERARLGLPAREEWIIRGDFSLESGHEAAARILAMSERPTAVFCASDEMACGFVGALLEDLIRYLGQDTAERLVDAHLDAEAAAAEAAAAEAADAAYDAACARVAGAVWAAAAEAAARLTARLTARVAALRGMVDDLAGRAGGAS